MSWQPTHDEKLRPTATGRAVRAIAEALFDRGAPVPAERIDLLEAELLALIDAAGPRARTLFVLCLFAVVVLAPLFLRRPTLLWRLPLSERIAALSKMEASTVGAPPLLAVKAPLCVLYYEQPAAAVELGWRPGGMHNALPMLPPATEERCLP